MTPLRRNSGELTGKEEKRGRRGLHLCPVSGCQAGRVASERTRDAALPLADTRRATRARPLLSSSAVVSPFLSPLHARCTLIGKHRPAALIAIGRRFLQITTLVRRRANQPSRDPRYRVR